MKTVHVTDHFCPDVKKSKRTCQHEPNTRKGCINVPLVFSGKSAKHDCFRNGSRTFLCGGPPHLWNKKTCERGVLLVLAYCSFGTPTICGTHGKNTTEPSLLPAWCCLWRRAPFRMLVVRADQWRNDFACWRVEFFASKHARLRRANTTATLYCCRHEREHLAIPTRSQP